MSSTTDIVLKDSSKVHLSKAIVRPGHTPNTVDLTWWFVAQASSLLYDRGLSRQDACATNLSQQHWGHTRRLLQLQLGYLALVVTIAALLFAIDMIITDRWLD